MKYITILISKNGSIVIITQAPILKDHVRNVDAIQRQKVLTLALVKLKTQNMLAVGTVSSQPMLFIKSFSSCPMAKNHWCAVDEIPKCCEKCNELDSYSKDEYSPSGYYCLKGLFLPTKKQTCEIKNKR